MEPKAIVSFDSHLDINVGSKRFIELLFNLPFPLRGAFLRNYVHSLLKRCLPKVPLYLVTPNSAFECNNVQRSRDGHDLIESELSKVISDKEAFEQATDTALNLLKGFGIHLFLSPPKNLKYLSEKVDRFTTVVDIDVDYMEEFQKFCYSKAPQFVDIPEQRHLGHLIDVTKTIDRIRPNLVLISEARLEQIEDSKYPLVELIDFLKSKEYSIENGELVDSDESAFEALRKFDKFQAEVMPTARRRIAMTGWREFDEAYDDLCLSLQQLLKEEAQRTQGMS